MIQRPKWLGGFYGGNLGFLNYEIFTIQNFARADLKCEAELMTVKWFDYRRLHPLQATYYFVQCYTVAYQDFYRKAIDKDRAPYVRCLSAIDFLEAKERATIFRLRQLVDRLGMRYDFFLRYAMNSHYRMVSQPGRVDKYGHKIKAGQVYAPRPGHLLNNEELIAGAVLAWEEQCKASLEIARDPYYRVSNFNGSRDQQAHEAFVIQQIKLRTHPRFALSTALYKYDAVRIEEAIRQFGPGMVHEAINEIQLA